MYKVAKIAVEKATPQFDKLYSYLIPTSLSVKIGCRVTIPFGSGNRRRMGIVLDLDEVGEYEGLKAISSLVDEVPILGDEQVALVHFLKEHTFCSYFDAVRVLVPAGLGMRLEESYTLCTAQAATQEELTPTQLQVLEYISNHPKGAVRSKAEGDLGLSAHHPAFEELAGLKLVQREFDDKRKISDDRVTMVRISEDFLEQENMPKLTAKQAKVLEFLQEYGCSSVKELCYFCAITKIVVANLQKLGMVELYEQRVFRNPYENVPTPKAEEIVLSPQQQQALDVIMGETKRPTLLYGVTGSGKTQVFLRLIDTVLAEGKQVIVMVPEISLTPQTIESFHTRYGGRTAVLHSSLTMSQRMDEWQRIKDGKADIVIGTRSAVFAPLSNIGLIVMDEEQEHTYKSEASPRFHTRDVARFRCARHGARLLLCSATPSVESYYFAKTGKYNLATITERYGGVLPEVFILDMSAQQRQSDTVISEVLSAELYRNLEAGEQSILLLNRRGYHTVAKCSACGEAVTCPNCSVTLTYHSANKQLMCHYCGHTQDIPTACPTCGSGMVRYSGFGTQRVQEELEKLFPQAKILRMDMDTTMSRFAYQKSFGAFAAGEYDIMVGTQMVSKGLNFPKVTLVGVLSADTSLYSEDFRCVEKTFSLLTQVVGRSGRYELPGRAFIQTYQPENPIFALASEQDYDRFFEEEIRFRKQCTYPPFCSLVSVGFAAVNEGQAMRAAKSFADYFAKRAGREYPELPIRLLGPSQAGVYKVAGKYRYQLLIKCRNSHKMRELLAKVQLDFYSDKNNGNTTAFIDMYYDNVI